MSRIEWIATMIASLAAIRAKSMEHYENNRRSLLMNPQWREALAGAAEREKEGK